MGTKGDRHTADGARFVESLLPRMAALEDVTSKKMFGGYGIFQDGKMFAIVSSKGELFLKADATNLSRFEKAGSSRHGKMPYFRIPEEVLSSDAKLLDWARSSVSVAHS